MIRFACGCGRRFSAPESSAGLGGCCPACGRKLRVPRGPASDDLLPVASPGPWRWAVPVLFLLALGGASALVLSSRSQHAQVVDRQRSVLDDVQREVRTAEGDLRGSRFAETAARCAKERLALSGVDDPELASDRSALEERIRAAESRAATGIADRKMREDAERDARAAEAAKAARDEELARKAREVEEAATRESDAARAARREEERRRTEEQERIAAERERQRAEERAARNALYLAHTLPARLWTRGLETGSADQMAQAAEWYRQEVAELRLPDSFRRSLATARRIGDAMDAAAARFRDALPRFEGDLPLKGDARLSKVCVAQVAEGRITFRYSFAMATGPFYKPVELIDVIRFLGALHFPDADLLAKVEGKGEYPGPDGLVTLQGDHALFEREGTVFEAVDLAAAGLVGRDGHAFSKAEEADRIRRAEAAAQEAQERKDRVVRAKEEQEERARERREKAAEAARAQEEAREARARAEEERRQSELERRRQANAGGSGSSSGGGSGYRTTYRCPKCGYTSDFPGMCPN